MENVGPKARPAENWSRITWWTWNNKMNVTFTLLLLLFLIIYLYIQSSKQHDIDYSKWWTWLLDLKKHCFYQFLSSCDILNRRGDWFELIELNWFLVVFFILREDGTLITGLIKNLHDDDGWYLSVAKIRMTFHKIKQNQKTFLKHLHSLVQNSI